MDLDDSVPSKQVGEHQYNRRHERATAEHNPNATISAQQRNPFSKSEEKVSDQAWRSRPKYLFLCPSQYGQRFLRQPCLLHP